MNGNLDRENKEKAEKSLGILTKEYLKHQYMEKSGGANGDRKAVRSLSISVNMVTYNIWRIFFFCYYFNLIRDVTC